MVHPLFVSCFAAHQNLGHMGPTLGDKEYIRRRIAIYVAVMCLMISATRMSNNWTNVHKFHSKGFQVTMLQWQCLGGC
jgi:hypothetical protein